MKKTIKRTLKTIARRFHSLACRSSALSRIYLNTSSAIVKRLPDRYGHHYLANVQHWPWPEVRFSSRRVWVTNATPVELIPHVGEFDFAALFLEKISYEQEVFDFLQDRLGGYDAIVEIGSNVGIFTSFFSRAAKCNGSQLSIFAFEPSREAFRRLLENLAINDASNVHAFNCAISKSAGFVDFFEPEGHLTNGSLSHAFADEFSPQVQCTPALAVAGEQLRTLLAPYRRILFKIDVEGAEAEVLASLRELIDEKLPDIVLEVLPSSEVELNKLDFIMEDYVLSNITKDGRIEKQHFEADTSFRDYFLSRRL